MKKFVFLVAASLFALTVAAQNLTKIAPRVVIVNLGPKNPHFDESVFPHLHFYYTPGIRAVLPDENAINHHYEIQGEPQFLVNAFNERQIKEYGFLLFDKNGICYTEGNNLMEDIDIGKDMCSNGKTLEDNLKAVVKKGKTAKISSSPLPSGHGHAHINVGLRHTSVTKAAYLTGHPFPATVKVVTPSGQTVSLQQIIKGEPTLVMFCYIPPRAAVEAVFKFYHGPDAKPSPAIQKKFSKDVLYFSLLEGQLFKFNPKKALKAKYGK
jgi:hypothetical protein